MRFLKLILLIIVLTITSILKAQNKDPASYRDVKPEIRDTTLGLEDTLLLNFKPHLNGIGSEYFNTGQKRIMPNNRAMFKRRHKNTEKIIFSSYLIYFLIFLSIP